MQVKPLLDKVSSKTFLEDYLTACGVECVKDYLNPGKNCFDDPWEYDNIDEAVELLREIISVDGCNVGILHDSDNDGCCSSAIIYDFIRKQNPTIHPIVFYHTGKQHGPDDLQEDIVKSGIDYLIIPDAGTNNYNACKYLHYSGIMLLIIDHHEVTIENPYAIIVNPFANKSKEVNRNTSGTGVTNDVVKYYCEKYNVACPDYSDLVAVSLITDICSFTSIGNRANIYYGLKPECENKFLRYLFEKCCAYRGLNSEGVAFGIGPLANALCRMSLPQEDKAVFFQGLVGEKEPEDCLKFLRANKREQDKAVKEAFEKIEVDNEHKCIVTIIDNSYAPFTGLIANKLVGEYHKPAFVLRKNNSTLYTGSMRSPIGLLQKINDSGLATCAGHDSACGVVVKASNLEKFKEWLDKLDLDVKPSIPVTAKIVPFEINETLCTVCNQDKTLWGKDVPKPSFYLKTHVRTGEVQVVGAKKNTLKLVKNDVAFMMFFAKEEDIEAFEQGGELEMIVELELNVWNDIKTCQGIIKQYEFVEEDDWMDVF